ncbi:MAG: thioredoxin family protein [Methanosarcinales archaeon]|jgi:thioredoxin-like negative regulator of GroEL|nr:thioredoxin family protein [Methanosarcinales archaeon]
MTITEATTETWDSLISNKEKPVMTMFYMESCPHCARMKPVFAELDQKYGGKVSFVQINAMNHMGITKRYGITAAPGFKIFKDGKLLNGDNAAMKPEQLEQMAKDLASGEL